VDHEFADEEAKFKALRLPASPSSDPTILLDPSKQVREGMRSSAEREQSLSRWYSRCVNDSHLQAHLYLSIRFSRFFTSYAGVASAQTRVADTIELFYTAADRTSDGALAANAYKRAVEDLDHSVTRELVQVPSSPMKIFPDCTGWTILGRTVPNDGHGASRQAQRTFPNCNRAHQQTKQEGEEPHFYPINRPTSTS